MKTFTLNLSQVQFQRCFKDIFINDIIHIYKNFYSNEYYTYEKIKNIKCRIKSICPEINDVGISFPEELNISSVGKNFNILILDGTETYPHFYASRIAVLKIEGKQVYISKMLEINETIFKNAKTSLSQKNKKNEIECYDTCSHYIKQICQLMFPPPKNIPFIYRQKGSDSIL